ncbi:MAG: cadherin-like beta sandwich domain-containing protein, partial [Roseburia sp.]|nr:cadherin-like beta sandwich domain-containing protein [Roseburia sp.]
QYTATVANDVTRVAVTATPANEKATVESVTGNENLSVGSNAVKIVVKAENGVTATYTITVTRQEAAASSENTDEPEVLTEEPVETTGEAVTIGETSYSIVDNFSAENIPAGFSESTVNYHGTDYKGVNFENGNLSMLYLVPAGTEDSAAAKFFIYDATGDGFYPFIQLKHGDNFIIWLPTPAEYAAAEGEQQVDITVNDGDTMTVHQLTGEETADFSFFYAVNQDGTTGWYQYDALEQTYQRQNSSAAAAATEGETEETVDDNTAYLQEEYNTLETEMKKEKSFSRTTIGVLIFIIAVLIVIIINLLLRRRDDMDDEDDGDDYEEQPKLKKTFAATRRSADDFTDDLEEEPKIKKTVAAAARSNDEFQDDLEEQPKIKKSSKAVRHSTDDFKDDYEEEAKREKKPKFSKRMTDDLEDDLEEQPRIKKSSKAVRRSTDDFADDYEEEAKREKKPKFSRRMTDDLEDELEEEPKVRKKSRFARHERDDFEDNYEELPRHEGKSESPKQEKESTGETPIHETVTRSKDGIEVIDFNDL